MRLVVDFSAEELCTIELTKEESERVGHALAPECADAQQLSRIALDLQTRYKTHRQSRMTIMGIAARMVQR